MWIQRGIRHNGKFWVRDEEHLGVPGTEAERKEAEAYEAAQASDEGSLTQVEKVKAEEAAPARKPGDATG